MNTELMVQELGKQRFVHPAQENFPLLSSCDEKKPFFLKQWEKISKNILKFVLNLP